jgi:hypothetical protein
MRGSYSGSTGVSKTSSVGPIPTPRAYIKSCKAARRPFLHGKITPSARE